MRFAKTLFIASLFLATTVAAGGDGAKYPVRVPVVLDGHQQLTADEFNSYQAANPARPLYSVLLPGKTDVLFVFTSRETMRTYLEARGIRPPRTPPSVPSPGTRSNSAGEVQLSSSSCVFDPYYSFFYEHVDCAGGYLTYGPGTSEGDLRNLGFNDRISSVLCTYHTTVFWCTLFEHIYFGGGSISIPAGSGVNLTDYGWNDRASSLIVETIN